MRKIDLIYENLLFLLNNLTIDGAGFTIFHAAQEEDMQDILLNVSESIATEKREIELSYARNEFYPDFTNLITFLYQFKDNFGSYPNFRENEVLAIISIVQKLTIEFGGADALNLDEEIIPENFEIIELNEEIVQDNFMYFDTTDITQSLFLFNVYNIEKFKEYINSITAGAEILYYLLSKIGRPAAPLTTSKYILVKTAFASKPRIVTATLCLHIIKTGAVIHKSYEYLLPPQVPTSNSIVLGRTYQQFSDSIGIISEYNYQKDILDKYLRIYHVFENFMYKSPLVKLERDSSGNVFSIRDFQRMYDRISDSELNMLKKLFSNILILEYVPGQTFSTKILTAWTGLIPTHFADSAKINHLIKLLNIKKSNGDDVLFGDFNIDGLPNIISKLIYAFRNSMVHNRETEFHLTHQTLLNHTFIENTALIVLENFLLPILEEIAFYLIINDNAIVWYDSSILKLWEND